MDVLEASQDLVEKVTDVVIAQPLDLQQLVKVRLHQGLHDVAGGKNGSRRIKTDTSRTIQFGTCMFSKLG